MSIYKTGHKKNPNIDEYSKIVDQFGANSPEAISFLEKFSDDTEFVKQASLCRMSTKQEEKSEEK